MMKAILSRRKFLKDLLVGGTIVILPPILSDTREGRLISWSRKSLFYGEKVQLYIAPPKGNIESLRLQYAVDGRLIREQQLQVQKRLILPLKVIFEPGPDKETLHLTATLLGKGVLASAELKVVYLGEFIFSC